MKEQNKAIWKKKSGRWQIESGKIIGRAASDGVWQLRTENGNWITDIEETIEKAKAKVEEYIAKANETNNLNKKNQEICKKKNELKKRHAGIFDFFNSIAKTIYEYSTLPYGYKLEAVKLLKSKAVAGNCFAEILVEVIEKQYKSLPRGKNDLLIYFEAKAERAALAKECYNQNDPLAPNQAKKDV